MDDRNDSTPTGYASSGYAASKVSNGAYHYKLWLPIAVADALKMEKEATAETDRTVKSVDKNTTKETVKKPVAAIKNLPDELKIRVSTVHDLADAKALAERFLSKAKTQLDPITAEFSKDLFIAVAIYIASTEKDARTLKSMVNFLIDPTWDSELQMLEAITGSPELYKQKETYYWFAKFSKKINVFSSNRAQSLVRRCYAHWQAAFTGSNIKLKTKVQSSVQVFNPDAMDKAMVAVANIAADKRAGSDHILENARLDEGFRAVPDTVKAGKKLEKAKSQFENLVEPISRLQVDLALAGAMAAEDFRITPILLLGDPGIGKTFLAMQLAEALGVDMEKISAGGAQGGFQLTGSHTSWTGSRPGSLFTVLAEGKFATPVVVIDEVDKIIDSRYPVLPVLLDLFEPNTSVRFKDEFFEMAFDASRIIFVLTANSLEGVPAPLLSRVEVFDVPRPEPAQRLRIIQEEAAKLCSKTKRPIKLDKISSEALAARKDVDLRKTTRLVREAFTRALQANELVAKLVVPKFEGRGQIGFGC